MAGLASAENAVTKCQTSRRPKSWNVLRACMQPPAWLLLHSIRFVYQLWLQASCKHLASATRSADSGHYCLRCGSHESKVSVPENIRLFIECVVLTPVALICALVLTVWNRFEKPDPRRDPH